MWLDPTRTSPFRFYQFWLNTDDRDVVRYLKFFTFMSRDEIDALAHATEEQPEATRGAAGAGARGDRAGARRRARAAGGAGRAGPLRRATSQARQRGRRPDGVRGCAVDRAGAAGRGHGARRYAGDA